MMTAAPDLSRRRYMNGEMWEHVLFVATFARDFSCPAPK